MGRWLRDAAHVPSLWYLAGPYIVLAIGCALITVTDILTR